MTRYPNYITFAWQRSDNDNDYEVVGTLNGETIDDDMVWNYLVEQTLTIMQMADPDTQAYNREDVVSVLEAYEGDDWEPIKMGAN
jgi:hypothetical protein